jgi:dTDP-4-dehydrorhamnose reductase
MKLLVLGSTGQLGTELMLRGVELGFDMVGLEHSELEVTDGEAFERARASHRPHVVINTTARNAVPRCEVEVKESYALHAASVQTMAAACRKSSVGFVTFSTDYVFDGEKGSPYREEDTPNPLQIYGLSKRAGEEACRRYHPEAVIVRTCGVYGGLTGSRAKKDGNFVLGILRQSKEGKEIEVSSEQIVNPVHAADLADATLRLLNTEPEGGFYHLATEGFCSWAEFAAAIVEIADSPVRIQPVDQGGMTGSLRRPRFSALANIRAKARGVVLPHWRRGLEEYVPWLLQQEARTPPGGR